jgi:hypothetical protein
MRYSLLLDFLANSVRVVGLQFLDGLEIPSDLAAPQCVASFGVRLDLHVIAPYLGFFLLGRAVPFSSGRFGNPSI